MVAAPPRQRLWTRAEYQRLIGLNFFAGQRVERIEGEIIEMGPMLGPHATALGLLQDALTPHVGTGRILRLQMPLSLGQDPSGWDSDPEPDLDIVAGAWRAFAATHPTTALLVVEIAESQFSKARARTMSREGGVPSQAGRDNRGAGAGHAGAGAGVSV